jgi:hypothetical protein
VKWFTDDGWDDITLSRDGSTWTYGSEPIDQELVTRAYTGGNPRRKQWQEAEIVVDTISPSFGIAALTEGYNQENTYRAGQTRDPSVFLTWNTEAFIPAVQPERANLPYREDYSWFESVANVVPQTAMTSTIPT